MTDFDLNKPVSKEDIERLKRDIRKIPLIREAIKDAEEAGLDQTEAKLQLDELEKKAKAFIKVYGNKV